MDDNADAKRILLAFPPADWRRQLGHPRIMWLSAVQHDLKQHHLTFPKQQIFLRTALWHSTTPCTVLPIGDERGRTTCLRVIKVRPHHAAPTPITLAESSVADRLQAGRPGLQMSSWPGTNFTIQQNQFRRHLHSASSYELSTYGDRAFPVAAVRIWNSLPQHITSAPSLPIFCSRLKTYFFELCYP